MKFMKFKNGFTLAEVLITLAIIGVVTALTIPSLIINYQKEQYVAQLKKNYTVLTNGFQQMMASEGVYKLRDTSMIVGLTGNNTDEQPALKESLNKYFKILKMYDYGTNPNTIDYFGLGGDAITTAFTDNFTTYLSDGSIVYWDLRKTPQGVGGQIVQQLIDDACKSQMLPQGYKMCEMYGSVIIDVNGEKKPNKRGRDVFRFLLDQSGRLVAVGSKEHSVFWSPIDWWNATSARSVCGKNNQSEFRTDAGDSCAGRVIEEGWKMNY